MHLRLLHVLERDAAVVDGEQGGAQHFLGGQGLHGGHGLGVELAVGVGRESLLEPLELLLAVELPDVEGWSVR